MQLACCQETMLQTFLVTSPGTPLPHSTASSTVEHHHTQRTRLDIPHLQQSVQQYCTHGASPSTWNTYSTGQQHYLTFCAKAQRKELPTSESTLMLFVSHLADTGLTHSTIKVYLSSVRHLHVTQGQHSQFSKQLTPRLQQVLKGIKKVKAATTHPRVRRPITLEIMQGIKSVLLSQSHSYQNTMIWAACCLAFFGFLRSSEFTVLAQDRFDNFTHLSP